MLATNRDEIAKFHFREGFENLWNQRTQFLDSIRARHDHYHANVRCSQILLE